MLSIVLSARPRARVLDLAFAVALTLLAAASIGNALAHDYNLGALRIEHPWARATPGGAQAAGGFMKITNTGATADRLIGGTLVAAGAVEIHEMRMDGDVMRMRRLARGLEIKPGQSIELRPGSYHVMFMKLAKGFKEGESIRGSLMFEKAGSIDVEFKIEPIGAMGAGHKH